MGGPMRMNPPRGMGGMGPQVGLNTQKDKRNKQNDVWEQTNMVLKESNDL